MFQCCVIEEKRRERSEREKNCPCRLSFSFWSKYNVANGKQNVEFEFSSRSVFFFFGWVEIREREWKTEKRVKEWGKVRWTSAYIIKCSTLSFLNNNNKITEKFSLTQFAVFCFHVWQFAWVGVKSGWSVGVEWVRRRIK